MQKILTLLLMVALIVSPAFALTDTGSFYSDYGTTQSTAVFAAPGTITFSSTGIVNITVYDISNVNGLKTVLWTFPSGSIINAGGYAAGQSNFTSIYGDGTFGYQALYNGAGTYKGGYVYAIFDEPIVTTQSGQKIFTLTFTPSEVHNFYVTGASTSSIPANVKDGSGNYMASISQYSGAFEKLVCTDGSGSYLYNNINKKFGSSYTASTGSIGAFGEINKTSNGTAYYSKAFVYASDGITILASESALNTNDFEFAVTSSPLYIRIKDAYGYWYNSSLLLSGGSYTTVNTYFQCVDGQDSSSIYGCNLALKDETAGYWSNSTADSDGTHYIATNSTDLVSGYATATGFQPVSRTNLATFSEGIYELIMWPDDSVCTTPGECGTAYDPGTGNVNLIIMVNDKDTSDPIADADIKLVEDVGATTYGTTNEAGAEMFFFSNKTQVRIVASKAGYTSASKVYTTSDFGPDTVRLELSKSYVTVTPTVTITDGSGNPIETIDIRTASEQDQALFDKLRKEAPELIDLCILGIEIFIIMGILAAMGMKL